MDRLSTINRIGDLNDRHCKSCPDRPSLFTKGARQKSQHCIKECPIGIELKHLGDQLEQISKSRRANKKARSVEVMPIIQPKRGPASKEAPSCGLTKQIYIEQIAAGETNASIERAWGMKANSLYDWIKRWDIKGLKAETAQELLEGKTPLLRSTSPAAKAIEEKAAGLSNLNIQRDAEEVKALSAKLLDRNAAYDRLLLENKSLHEQLGERNETAKQLAEDRDIWSKEYATLEEVYAEVVQDRNSWRSTAEECKRTIAELEADKQLLLETIERETDRAAKTAVAGEPVTNQDNVNHPAHYTAGGIECIDAIEAALTGLTGGQAYSTGAAIKYLWRWSRKNGIEDLQKARWYVDRIIKELEAAQ